VRSPGAPLMGNLVDAVKPNITALSAGKVARKERAKGLLQKLGPGSDHGASDDDPSESAPIPGRRAVRLRSPLDDDFFPIPHDCHPGDQREDRTRYLWFDGLGGRLQR